MTSSDDVLTGTRPVAAISDADARAGTLARFAAVMQAQPDLVAVADEGGRLSYRELAAAAAAVRADLAGSAGRRPVALLHSHDRGAIAAVFGVLASGHPLLVLDPRTPAARLAAFVEQAGAAAVLADAANADAAAQVVAGRPDCRVVPVDLTRALAADLPAESLWRDAPTGTETALLAFTSGSTGTPKGVLNTHGLLVRDAHVSSIGTGAYDADDVVAHTLPLAFHAGITIAIAGVLVGCRLELRDVRATGVATLPGWLQQIGATVAHTSPAILRAIVAQRPDPALFATLRTVTIAGEAAHGRDVEALRALLPDTCAVRHRYGSSETGLISEYVVRADHPELSGPLPIGRPVPGTDLTALDELGEPVPDGDAGTVAITAPYVASGYWQAPDLTAAAFTDLPDGRRRFRSQDVGAQDGDGSWRLLGRRDHSVKVRGLLVEPGEVDAALFGLDDVREALTVGALRPSGESYRLVSYVVSSAEQPSAARVRAGLRQLLPSHMVPEAVVFLGALPRTDRGKLDRSALPPPPTAGTGPKGPMTEWQVQVAQVFAKALELDEVGPDDDFFELGGDSLAVEALITSVVADLGVSPTAATSSVLVQAPTVRDFAARLRRTPDKRGAVLVPLRPEGSRRPLFVVAGGGGLGVAFVALARGLDPEVPVWALQSPGMERRALPDRTVVGAARRSLKLLRSVQPHGPYRIAGHSFGGLVAFEMCHQLRAAGEQVELLAVLDSFPPDPALHPQPPVQPLPAALKQNVGLLTTGLVSPGEGHYWRFFELSTRAGLRYRGAPWDGRAVVVVADSPDRALREQWGPHLSGDWSLVAVGGDHLSMLREPYVAGVATAVGQLLDAIDGISPVGSSSGASLTAVEAPSSVTSA